MRGGKEQIDDRGLESNNETIVEPMLQIAHMKY